MGQSMSFLDDPFKTIERIGGTVSYLEGELQPQLTQFRKIAMTPKQELMADLA